MDKLTYQFTYQYWRDNVCDERLEYLDSDEKYKMYLEWKEKEEEKKEIVSGRLLGKLDFQIYDDDTLDIFIGEEKFEEIPDVSGIPSEEIRNFVENTMKSYGYFIDKNGNVYDKEQEKEEQER